MYISGMDGMPVWISEIGRMSVYFQNWTKCLENCYNGCYTRVCIGNGWNAQWNNLKQVECPLYILKWVECPVHSSETGGVPVTQTFHYSRNVIYIALLIIGINEVMDNLARSCNINGYLGETRKTL